MPRQRRTDASPGRRGSRGGCGSVHRRASYTTDARPREKRRAHAGCGEPPSAPRRVVARAAKIFPLVGTSVEIK
jgi:hypothetical protein